MRRVAVIGGGINGSGIAWELARRGYEVVLFDKGRFGAATSSATTKLIHGGLRYLEQWELRLVTESLRERSFLLEKLPELVRPLELILPLFDSSPRSQLLVHTGLVLYDLLAGRRRNVGRHRTLDREEVLAKGPLRAEGLGGGFLFFDAQVDDRRLVERVIACARRDGVDARESTEVELVRQESGRCVVVAAGRAETFDFVVNAAGPWMRDWVPRNGIDSDYRLTLVRGSHIVLESAISESGFVIQSTVDGRVVFVLPWKGGTLIGTTEELHRGSPDEVFPSSNEIAYLLASFNRHFTLRIGRSDVADAFAGVRPLIASRRRSLGSMSRDYRIEKCGRIVNVFGGKLTTFLALSRSVGDAVDEVADVRSDPLPPDFTLVERAATV